MEKVFGKLVNNFKRYSTWNGKNISDNALRSYLQLYSIKRNILKIVKNPKNLKYLPKETMLTYLIFIIRIEIYIKSLIVKDRIIDNSINH